MWGSVTYLTEVSLDLCLLEIFVLIILLIQHDNRHLCLAYSLPSTDVLIVWLLLECKLQEYFVILCTAMLVVFIKPKGRHGVYTYIFKTEEKIL
jgi:hypothetical protein